MASLADLLRAAGSGLYGSAGGFIPDTGVNLANLARAAYGYGGSKLGLLAPQDMPDMIDPANVPGTTANVSGLLGVGNSVPEQVAQFAGGLLAPGGKGKAATKLEATVYHGSPHSFENFDMSHLGSGEGAQAFGHGLYFADNPDVARQYALAGNGTRPFVDGTPANRMQLSMLENSLTNMYHNRLAAGLSPAEAAWWTQQWGAAHPQIGADAATAFTAKLSPAKGNLYTVDIPDDAIGSMLHWDKPLSQQSPSVQAALGASDKEAGLVNTMPDMTGQQLYNELSLAMGGRDKAAQFLNAQGIPGIRYLDAGSRGVGDGTYNTVLFNDQLAQILGRQ